MKNRYLNPGKGDGKRHGNREANEYLRKRKLRHTWGWISAFFSVVVAIAMFQSLKKPAITMEVQTCQMEEHVHTEACYGYDHEATIQETKSELYLDCAFQPHVHTEDCWDENGTLICGYAEEYIHVHDDFCYVEDENGERRLVCGLNGLPEHEHTDECYTRVLVCGQEENPGHIHTDECYTTEYFLDEDPVCGLEETDSHVHSEECYADVLVCELDHEHTDACFIKILECGMEEGQSHVHTQECYPSIRNLTCELEETEGHVHDDSCWAMLLDCPWEHVHTEECFDENGHVICGHVEILRHQHTEECFTPRTIVVKAGHVHSDACEKVLICGKEEHVHSSSCFSTVETANTEGLVAEVITSDPEIIEERVESDTAESEQTEVSTNETEENDLVPETESEGLIDDDTLSLVSADDIPETSDAVILSDLVDEEFILVEEDPEWDAGFADVPNQETDSDNTTEHGLQTRESVASQDDIEQTVLEASLVLSDDAMLESGEESHENPETNSAGADDADQSLKRDGSADFWAVPDQQNLFFALFGLDDELPVDRILASANRFESEVTEISTDSVSLQVQDGLVVCSFAFRTSTIHIVLSDGTELRVDCAYEETGAEEIQSAFGYDLFDVKTGNEEEADDGQDALELPEEVLLPEESSVIDEKMETLLEQEEGLTGDLQEEADDFESTTQYSDPELIETGETTEGTESADNKSLTSEESETGQEALAETMEADLATSSDLAEETIDESNSENAETLQNDWELNEDESLLLIPEDDSNAEAGAVLNDSDSLKDATGNSDVQDIVLLATDTDLSEDSDALEEEIIVSEENLLEIDEQELTEEPVDEEAIAEAELLDESNEASLVFQGEDYQVVVFADEEAGIPKGSRLVVSELTETEAVEAYKAKILETTDYEAERISVLRLFDLQIQNEYGEKIEPLSKVSVVINMNSVKDTEMHVVHFVPQTTGENAANDGIRLMGKQKQRQKQAVTPAMFELPDMETVQVLEAEVTEFDERTWDISFETDGFSMYAIVGTTIERTVLASDGLNYRITATYGTETGIPEEAELEVNEILPDENNDVNTSSAYDEYVSKTENALGWEAGSASYARVFEIKIVDKDDPDVRYQPNEGTNVDVRIELADVEEKNELNVVHFADEEAEGDVVAYSTENGTDRSTVEFAADGFSVYVIINHEGEETVVTPRVEFHFIAEDFSGTGPYTASPYNFVNTAGDYQHSQILKNGESLELITNPSNIVIDNGDGTTTEKFFYGWYMVNSSSDTSALNNSTGKYEGAISYTWPSSDLSAVNFEDNLVINDSENLTVGDTVSWTLGDISGTGTIDSEGRVHVYLAPLYEDFYFINFRKGPKEDTTGLSNSLLSRRMIVFGSGNTAIVRIGDVVCPSSDPQHRIFVGWETVIDNDGLTRDEYYQTVDFEGNELDSPGSEDGYYITVNKDTSTLTQVDLYPVFAEARWLKFDTGKSGNGAKYVGSAYRVTNDEGVGNYFDSAFFTGTGNNDSHLSSRAGYEFEGWYAFANRDDEGNITNLTEPQNVTVHYLDETGTTQTITVNAKAVKIVNSDGTFAYDGAYNLDLGGGNTAKLFEIVDGKMYLYKAMDDLTLFANWTVQPTTYRVIVWKQKVTDDKNTTKTPVDLLNWLSEDTSRKADDYPYTLKSYDYEIFYTSNLVDPDVLPDLARFSGSYVDSDSTTRTVNNRNLLGENWTGFHYSCNDVAVVGTPNPDGTTVYNVYYDRDLRAINYYYSNITPSVDYYPAYTYTVTTSNSGTQYGIINDQYIQLTYNASTGKWTAPEYAYQYQIDNTNGTFGKVGDAYVELTPKYETTTVYALTSTLSANNDYLIVSDNNAGSGYALGHSDTSVVADAVTINPGSQVYINGDDVDNTSVWSVSGNYKFQNDDYYLRYSTRNNSNNNTLGVGSNDSYNTWSLRTGYRNGLYEDRYDLCFSDNSFELSRSDYSNVYLYQKTTDLTIAGYTYDNNGTPTEYTGENRYSYNYVPTGENTEYTATRFTRSNNTLGYNYHLVTWSGLYGQTFAPNGYNWDNVSSYYWREGTTPGSGTGQTFLDSFIQDTNPYNLVTNSNRGNFALYHYKQQFDGSYTMDDRETAYLTLGSGSTTFNLTNKFDGFTVNSYNVGTNGFSSTGGSNTGSSVGIRSSDGALHVYHTRDKSDLTFDINYPVDANLVYSNGKSENLTVADIYYQYPLTEYGSGTVDGKTNWYYGVVDDNNTAQHELVGPDHYIFGGWYEDASCTVPFNFDSTMPVGNKIVYAKWDAEWFVMHIDPNGAEIDHINHATEFSRDAIPDERPADRGYDPSQSTYFWLSYGGAISEYAVSRNYVPISEAAAEQYDGQIYYYMNHQYSHDLDGDYGLNANARNAIFLTEEEIAQYYAHYADYAARAGVTVLDYGTWRQYYTSYGKQKYRITKGQEHYEFLGWYQVFNAGTEDEYLSDMPYVFSTPISSDLYLRAMWRLDGGYTVQYVPEYTMPDGAIINGEMENWVDPPTNNLSYADGAATEIYKQPTDLKKNGVSVDDDSVIFLGWQLVSKTGTDEHPVYTPLESGVYYNPSDPYTVNAANAGTDSTIYFQAVYQYKDASDRRPVITNLSLDANTGYVNTSDSEDLPDWNYYPGSSWINTEDHLLGSDPTQILFGDIQSSAAVHLYKYATELTEDASGNAMEDSHQFFTHPDGYFLLGFDDSPTEGDYVATYPSDSVIAVTRDDDKTIYAVWEPMVYLTLKNETDVGDVIFNISSSSTEALEVINVKNGMYDRQPLSSLSNITLADGESITLAFPKGAEKDITISGTNTLGVGNVLIWNSSVDLVEDGTTTSYDTASIGENVIYSHNGDETDTHTLVTGEANNTKPFTFNESLVANENAVTVTFTSRDNAYALVLDDNYTGGGTQEYDYSSDDIAPAQGVPQSQVLPSTSTRIGYEFQGWAYSPTAETPDFSATSPADSPWTIPDLNADNGFFSEGTTNEDGTVVRTLYAVWKAKADSQIVYVYKDVPLPGNQDEMFDFTVAITGTYHIRSSNTDTINESAVFQLKHGWYLKLTSSNDNATASGHTTAYVQSIVQIYDAEGHQQGTDATVRWERTGLTSSSQNGFNNDLKISVTETKETYYDTSVTRNAQTEANKLYIGDSTDVETLPLTVETNTTYWTNTDAGGTVVYTNTRQTHDISVEKILHSNTSAAAIFSFTASYTLDGNAVDLGSFTVQSGTTNTEALKNIPAGAVLTITEVMDTNDIYNTTTSSAKHAEDQDTENAKVFTFTVSEDDTITFNNTLKSWPVVFRLVDQDGNPSINGMFSLASSIGSLGTDLYASTTSMNPPAGQFYSSDTFWADTYTLNQTIIPTGYIGPNGPVTLMVTGNGIESSDPENVTVEPDGNGGYIITVINRATKKVTIKKILIDSLLTNTRQFGFSYSYVPQNSEGTATGEAVTGDFTLAPVSNDEDGLTYELTVPINASVTVTEKNTGNYTTTGTVYDTSVGSEDFTDSDETDGCVFTVSKVEADGTIVFTNTRKTQTVTVKKVFEDSEDTIEVPFTATLLNGANAISGYEVYQGEGGTLETDDSGKISFKLKHNETQELRVPYGAKLVMEETADGYIALITTDNEVQDEDDIDNCFTMTVTADDTVTFTNRKSGINVILKKVGADSATQEIIADHLGGAKFTIFEENGTTVATGTVDGISGELNNLTSSSEDGVFFNGVIAAGTYYLHETEAPPGYYTPAENLRMTVAADGTVNLYVQSSNTTTEFTASSEGNASEKTTEVIVKNFSGYALPSTGGPGTRLVYLLGIMLAGIAGCGLAVKRRKSITL